MIVETTLQLMQIFFPRTCCADPKKHDKREHGLFKEDFHCTEMLFLYSKTFCCYDNKSNQFKFSSKGLTGDGPMSKDRQVLDKLVNLKSTNRGSKTSIHLDGTYAQTKKGLSYFYPKILQYNLLESWFVEPFNLPCWTKWSFKKILALGRFPEIRNLQFDKL